ncbi:flagellar hook-length control protein FliK [Paracoccaceae bacterium]|nr:flagellar hook-length control protein FliK [Paracoccaceae bacterium]
MTEIIKNNSSMTFDLVETGNGGTNSPDKNGVFNDLFGGVEAEGNDETNKSKKNPNKSDEAELDILAIAEMLTISDLDISDGILEEIKNRLKNLFDLINVEGVGLASVNSEALNSLGNEYFKHIMTFLEELESLIKLEKNGKDINPLLDPILNRIRIKLNEQVKAAIDKKIISRDRPKIDGKLMPQDQKIETIKKEATLHNKDNLSSVETNPNEAYRGKLKGSELDTLKKNNVRVDPSKTLSSKTDYLNVSPSSEKKVALLMDNGKKVSESKMDSLAQNSTNTTLTKDLNSESTLVRPPSTLSNKLDNISNFEPSNIQKSQQFNKENNDRLLHTLNMMSKSWGNNLIEKIEKSIEDGIEQLEILLTPKSLGRLNVIINISDTITKINIIAESANAAALLGDAESKLSQMMEGSGLKLASLQTQTNQFGGNHKGKGHAHKLASTAKKTNIEDSSKPTENINKLKSKNEGLNLIA